MNEELLRELFRWSAENVIPAMIGHMEGTVSFLFQGAGGECRLLELMFWPDGDVVATQDRLEASSTPVATYIETSAQLIELLNWVIAPTLPVPVPGEGDGANER